MTVHRPWQVLFAAAALSMPACVSISTRPAKDVGPELAAQATAAAAARAAASVSRSAPRTGTDFAVYASRPGEVIPARSVARDGTQKPPPGPVPPGPLVPVKGTDPTPAPATPAFPVGPVKPTPPEEHALLRAVRAHLEGKPERAFEAIATMERPTQDVVLAVLPVLARGTTANLAGDPAAAAAMVDGLRTAAARLEPLANLRVDAALFCDEVYGFSRYKPHPPNQPYRPHDKAQLYLEVRNLVSQPAAGPRGETYLTQVRAQVEVRDAHGHRVLQPHANDYRRRVEVVELVEPRYTRAPIQEFHFVYSFPAPAAPGVYTVTATLTDAAGRRAVKTQPVEFTVAGP